jgi:hypothetical protein
LRALHDATPNAERSRLSLKLKPPASASPVASSGPRTAEPDTLASTLPEEPQAAPDASQEAVPTVDGPTIIRRYTKARLLHLVERLRAIWPLAFPDAPRPLAIGSGRLIMGVRGEKLPGLTRKDISHALHFYVTRPVYLLALANGVERVDLAGKTGAPDAEQRLSAMHRLARHLKGQSGWIITAEDGCLVAEFNGVRVQMCAP